jgi:hypothetical protein
MSKFKVGDKVKRITNGSKGMIKGNIYTISDITCEHNLYFKELPSHLCWIASQFELVKEDTSKHHVHHDLIIAWAKGAEIECKKAIYGWTKVDTPKWQPDCKYRIKPEPCPEKEELTSIIADMKEQLAEATKRLEELE